MSESIKTTDAVVVKMKYRLPEKELCPSLYWTWEGLEKRMISKGAIIHSYRDPKTKEIIIGIEGEELLDEPTRNQLKTYERPT